MVSIVFKHPNLTVQPCDSISSILIFTMESRDDTVYPCAGIVKGYDGTMGHCVGTLYQCQVTIHLSLSVNEEMQCFKKPCITQWSVVMAKTSLSWLTEAL